MSEAVMTETRQHKLHYRGRGGQVLICDHKKRQLLSIVHIKTTDSGGIAAIGGKTHM